MIERTRWRITLPAEILNEFSDEFPDSMEISDEGRLVTYLSKTEYSKQMSSPNDKWHCPITGYMGWFDDEWYENYNK